jgi:hypothetical protein
METNIEQFSETSETSEKRHATAATSREAYIVLCNNGRLIDQKKTVYQAIVEHQPITSRRIANVTKQERSSVCRSLYDLLNEINPSIKVCYVDKCEITQRRVKHYSTINWQQESPREDNTSDNLIKELTQSKLFNDD